MQQYKVVECHFRVSPGPELELVGREHDPTEGREVSTLSRGGVSTLIVATPTTTTVDNRVAQGGVQQSDHGLRQVEMYTAQKQHYFRTAFSIAFSPWPHGQTETFLRTASRRYIRAASKWAGSVCLC